MKTESMNNDYQATKRMFIGLPISDSCKNKISRWQQERHWLFKPVPRDNFHLTLVFLGQVNSEQEQEIIKQCQSIFVKQFSVTLTDLTHWQKPKAIVINTEQTPDELNSLVKTLRAGAKKVGFQLDDRDYHPHVTLFRKANHLPNNAAINLMLNFDRFCLFHSKSTESGVKYTEIKHWPLLP